MNDAQLIEQLRTALDHETSQLRANPDAAQRARSRGQRRRVARGLLASLPAAALATGLLIATHSRPARPATGSQTGTAAYVVKHVEAALAHTGSRYLVRYRGNPDGATTWGDPRTGRTYTVLGTGVSMVSQRWNGFKQARGGRAHYTIEADYPAHTWWEQLTPASRLGRPTGRGSPALAAEGGSPQALRTLLAAGQLRVAGRGIVHGQHAIELRGRLSAHYDHATLTVWVDAHTFQPFRLITSFGGGAHPLDVVSSWVPRTPALVRLINHPHIPAGFHRVPAPR